MLDKIIGPMVSKRLIAYVVNKIVILLTPILAVYGLHVDVDEKLVVATLIGLVANFGTYAWAETHRPSKTDKK